MSDIPVPQKRQFTSEPSPRKQICNTDRAEGHLKSMNLFIKTFQEINPINVRCWHKDCSNVVVFKCLLHQIFTCDVHFILHSDSSNDRIHDVISVKIESSGQKHKKLAKYIKDYNSDLKILKQTIEKKVFDHQKKIQDEMDILLKQIDLIWSQNVPKIKLTIENRSIFENIILLEQFIDSGFQTKFTNECYNLPISDGLSYIIRDQICEYNSSKSNVENPYVECGLDRRSSNVVITNDRMKMPRNPEILNNESFDKILHWCKWETDKVHYYDLNEKTEKSISISNLIIPAFSRSISIDQNNILLCGGSVNLPETNENTSKVYKIDLKTRFYLNLKSMETGRTDFCMTYLNGFYYALGGLDYNKKILTKCERYSLENNKWKKITFLRSPRCAATCVSVSENDCIYVIGGNYYNGKLNKNIEIYNAKINIWTIVKTNRSILGKHLGSCLLPDSKCIFIFGGSNLNECQKETYFYNYETNKITDTNPMTSNNNDVLNEPVIYGNEIYCYYWISCLQRELLLFKF